MLAVRLACALYAQERFEEAAAYAERSKTADEGVMGQILWRGVTAKILARLGDLDASVALAREAVRIAESTDAINVHGDALMDLAEIASMAGETEEVASATEAAIALYELKGNVVSTARARSLSRGV